MFHVVGTASMLPRKEGEVVDPDLVVYGTANLRIVCLPLFENTACCDNGNRWARLYLLPINISVHPMAVSLLAFLTYE